MLKSVDLIVTGKLMSKSNSRIITSFGGRPRLIKKPAAIYYERDAISQVMKQLGALHDFEEFKEPVSMTITVWYENKRPDLDVSLIQDVLEKAGVYHNDRLVYEIHAFKRFDKEYPRLEVRVEELETS